MNQASFESWLAEYGRAWMSRNARAAAELFTEDGTYQVTPFVDAMRGRPAILDYWKHVAQTQRDIEFDCEVLAVTPEIGIARWWATFVIEPPGLPTKLDGIFLVCLDDEGRCRSFREWWHKDQN
jgi:hypothetical protein